MNKIILALCFMFLLGGINAQDVKVEMQPSLEQIVLGWVDKDRDADFEAALWAAALVAVDRPQLFFKAWATAHAQKGSQPLSHYFDQNGGLEIKENLGDRVVLRKLKRAIRKQLKQEVKDLKAFVQEKDLNAKIRFKAAKYKLEVLLAEEKKETLEQAFNGRMTLDIYPVYTALELLGGKEKGPLLRLDSLWQASGDPSEALPKLEKSILEIGEMGYVQGRKDPFILLLNEKDTQKVFNYLRGSLAHSLLPDAVFMASLYPYQNDETTDAYYNILVLKKNEDQMTLDAQNLNRIYINEQEWGKVLGFEMKAKAAKDWEALTSKSINQSLAIVLEGKIYSYPRVMEKIEAGKVEISGDFEGPELKALKDKLMPEVLSLYWKIIN